MFQLLHFIFHETPFNLMHIYEIITSQCHNKPLIDVTVWHITHIVHIQYQWGQNEDMISCLSVIKRLVMGCFAVF